MPFVVTVEGVEGQKEEKIYLRRSMSSGSYSMIRLTREIMFAKVYHSVNPAGALASATQEKLNQMRKRNQITRGATLDRKRAVLLASAKVVIEEI